MVDDILLTDVRDQIATITLNRPDARNALSAALITRLREAMADLDARDDVDVIVLTGTDPAFCAGLDLEELGSTGANISATADRDNDGLSRPWNPTAKPVIGAVNGVAVTGGFELALNCDFIVASTRAHFADTHSRVGVMPGWGLTVLLPQAVGVRRARQLSFTGQFLDADTALAWGLVNEIVPHAELLSRVHAIALEIAGNEQDGVRQIRATYAAHNAAIDAWQREAADGAQWKDERFTPEAVASRRSAIQERGRSLSQE